MSNIKRGSKRDHGSNIDPGERRDYFRIRDRIILDYRIVPAGTASGQSAEQFFPPSSTFDLMRELRALENEHSLTRGGAEYDREVDQQLRLLNRKIELVANAVVALDQTRDGLEPQPVSLSEGGVAFAAEETLNLGSRLALRIQLLPELVGLCLYGEVVDNRDEPPGYTAVRFTELAEADRQLLARHILKHQIEARRQNRQRR